MTWEAWRAWSRDAPLEVLEDFVELRGMHPAASQLLEGDDQERAAALAEGVSIVLDELAFRINHHRRI